MDRSVFSEVKEGGLTVVVAVKGRAKPYAAAHDWGIGDMPERRVLAIDDELERKVFQLVESGLGEQIAKKLRVRGEARLEFG